MADPVPTTQPETEKPKRTRGILNQAQLQALTKAGQVCTAAAKYPEPFAARTITADFVATLVADIKTARKKGGEAVSTTNEKEGDSIEEDDAESELVTALQEVQSAAKQKYGRKQPEKLPHFYVGTRLNRNRATLEQTSESIINKLAAESLPGITPAKVQRITELRAAYMDANSDQSSNQSEATKKRHELEQAIQSITDRRIEIQHAADAEWPYSNDLNQGVRKEFFLPLSMPFNG
jgi:hypothetical protein